MVKVLLQRYYVETAGCEAESWETVIEAKPTSMENKAETVNSKPEASNDSHQRAENERLSRTVDVTIAKTNRLPSKRTILPFLARRSIFADNRNSLIRHRLIDPLENYRR